MGCFAAWWYEKKLLLKDVAYGVVDSIIPIDIIIKISRLWLASKAEQASISLNWSQTYEDRFSHDVAFANISLVISNIYNASRSIHKIIQQNKNVDVLCVSDPRQRGIILYCSMALEQSATELIWRLKSSWASAWTQYTPCTLWGTWIFRYFPVHNL